MYDLARIPTTAQLRALEAAWIKVCHKDWGMVLMEAAGLNAAQIALSLLEGTTSGVVVVCGRGNNGGDGLVVARHLQRHSVPVTVHMVRGDKQAQKEPETESTINRRILEDCVGLPVRFFDEESLDQLEEAVTDNALIIDALLGTGLDRDVAGIYADAIDIINGSGNMVLSIDIPSGIHSDSGQVMGVAVEADVTATFGYLKAGLLHYPGAAHCGLLVLVDIGLPSINTPPPPLHKHIAELESPKWWLTTHAHVRDWLPPRPADGHKGTFGRVLAIAGSLGMTGSCLLAARSALRSGAGYAVLATSSSAVRTLPPEEIVYKALKETKAGAIDAAAIEELGDDLLAASAVLLGPGLGADQATVKLVEALLPKITCPCVIDADGLNAIAKLKGIKLPPNFVLTPHPRELERLTGTPTPAIQADRIQAARAACDKFGCSIVLKGAHTVVATPDEGVWIVPTGNSGMATPGSGDVLSGIIAAFLALGMHPSYAAVAGAYVHGAAGDYAADAIGEDGMVASDIMDGVRHVLAEIRDGDYQGRTIESEVLHLS